MNVYLSLLVLAAACCVVSVGISVVGLAIMLSTEDPDQHDEISQEITAKWRVWFTTAVVLAVVAILYRILLV